jgi:hypothetical protein
MDEKKVRKLIVDVRNRTVREEPVQVRRVIEEPVQVRRVIEEDEVGVWEWLKTAALALVVLAVFYLFVVVVFSF